MIVAGEMAEEYARGASLFREGRYREAREHFWKVIHIGITSDTDCMAAIQIGAEAVQMVAKINNNMSKKES